MLGHSGGFSRDEFAIPGLDRRTKQVIFPKVIGETGPTIVVRYW